MQKHLRAEKYYHSIGLNYYETDGVVLREAQELGPLVDINHNDVRFPTPLLRMTRDMAQELMDDLWQCGIRPTEGAGSAGSLAAVQAHLMDMRALVSATYKVELKK